jgi:hypothetical protein
MLNTSPPWCLRDSSGNVTRRIAFDAVDDVDAVADDDEVRDTGTLDVVDIIRRKTEKLIFHVVDFRFFFFSVDDLRRRSHFRFTL